MNTYIVKAIRTCAESTHRAEDPPFSHDCAYRKRGDFPRMDMRIEAETLEEAIEAGRMHYLMSYPGADKALPDDIKTYSRDTIRDDPPVVHVEASLAKTGE